MFKDRLPLYQELGAKRNTKVIVYVTGDRRQLETQVSPEVVDLFTCHLDPVAKDKRISLYLYTRGGDTLAAWNIANLIRQFADYLEVIVPSKAHSAGTLMCLGANNVIMTKQATLGPIDPSVLTALNPQILGAPADARFPVSVEDVNGFMEFSKDALAGREGLDRVLASLCDKVHPLVLGKAFRARTQIRMLAKKLLSNQIQNLEQVERILQFLCSESGSHDYTINRREAKDELGLPIEKPNDDLYSLIKRIYDDIANELQLTVPYDPRILVGAANEADYCFRRALIESVAGGTHVFISEGKLSKRQVQTQPNVVETRVHDQRLFEGWRTENA